jgi:hypothetical protein
VLSYIKLISYNSNIITGISELDPYTPEFNLEQNYPNPFNPVTKIRYSIPSNVRRETTPGGGQALNQVITAGASVKLIVFDILGNEVATLVNEINTPGNYEVEWNAAGLASGVYFYKLKAGGFTSVKKLILLR